MQMRATIAIFDNIKYQTKPSVHLLVNHQVVSAGTVHIFLMIALQNATLCNCDARRRLQKPYNSSHYSFLHPSVLSNYDYITGCHGLLHLKADKAYSCTCATPTPQL